MFKNLLFILKVLVLVVIASFAIYADITSEVKFTGDTRNGLYQQAADRNPAK